MEIILLERVEKLGQMGDVVKVKDGFARNYLLPQRKALRATLANKERFARDRSQLEARNLTLRKEAEQVSTKLDNLTVTLLRQAGESGQLYGSVSAADVANAVTAAGFSLARRQVMLNVPIKTLGVHKLRAALHPEVIVTVNVNVARSEAEAQVQAGGGVPAPEQFFEEGVVPELAAEGETNPDEAAPETGA
jgi:large subunit ribosomal protein L9